MLTSRVAETILRSLPAPIRNGLTTNIALIGLLTGTGEATGYTVGELVTHVAAQVISTLLAVLWVVTLVKAATYDNAAWASTGHGKGVWMFVLLTMPLYGMWRFWFGRFFRFGHRTDRDGLSMQYELMRARADRLTAYSIAVEQGVPDRTDPALYALTPHERAQALPDRAVPSHAAPSAFPRADTATIPTFTGQATQHQAPGADEDWKRSVYRPPTPNQEPPT